MGWSDVSKRWPWQARKSEKNSKSQTAMLIEERIHSNEHVAVHGVVYHALSVCPFTRFDDYHVLRPPRINAAIELARWTRRGPCQLSMIFSCRVPRAEMRMSGEQFRCSFHADHADAVSIRSSGFSLAPSMENSASCQGQCWKKFCSKTTKCLYETQFCSTGFHVPRTCSGKSHSGCCGLAQVLFHSFRRKCRWFPGQDSGTCRALLRGRSLGTCCP